MSVARSFLLLPVLLAASGLAAEPDYSDELPRIAPTEPADALKTFKIVDGFRLELLAHEPMVVDPIEMRGDSEQPKDNLGRVRLLEDTDGDGQFDRSDVFVDGLSWPTAVACWDGGVFVGAAPDIWYFKDTDGDRKADVKRRVFTGFGRGNVQGLLNSFRWGLDNRIHGATSSAGGNVVRVDDPEMKPLALRGRDFAFDPRTLEIEATSGGGQHGMCFDDFGRKFVCSNSDHLQMIMYEDRDIARNPYLAAPRARISIAADGGQAPVFRISPVEPWRIVRTRLRVAKQVPGPIEGGGRPAGYFTGATGVTIYRGDAWPAEHKGTVFIGDVGSNIVHRKRLEPKGLAFVGQRIDEGREFLASTDIWFRPVQFANGPDGCLYVLDMYREVIEHPKSLPPVIKKHLDLTSGRERGRIYRVARLLGHPNAWHRETAARLLYERQAPALSRLYEKAEPYRSLSAHGRIHVLHALMGFDPTYAFAMRMAQDDASPAVRAHATRLAALAHPPNPATRAAIIQSVDDPHIQVRYAGAFALGDLPPGRDRVNALATLLRQDGGDGWMHTAVLSSAGKEGGDLLAALLQDGVKRIDESTLIQLAEMVGRQHDQHQITLAARAIDKFGMSNAAAAERLRKRLDEGLTKAKAARAATRSPPPPLPRKTNRDDIVRKYRPALALRGDMARGRMVFRKTCAACHKAEGVGVELGPNLIAAVARGAETVLINVLDPNREVNPQYVQYIATTVDGRQVTGMITGESATSVTLTRGQDGPGASETLLRVDIVELRNAGVTLMPEGLEKDLNPQAMADLLAYLQSLK